MFSVESIRRVCILCWWLLAVVSHVGALTATNETTRATHEPASEEPSSFLLQGRDDSDDTSLDLTEADLKELAKGLGTDDLAEILPDLHSQLSVRRRASTRAQRQQELLQDGTAANKREAKYFSAFEERVRRAYNSGQSATKMEETLGKKKTSSKHGGETQAWRLYDKWWKLVRTDMYITAVTATEWRKILEQHPHHPHPRKPSYGKWFRTKHGTRSGKCRVKVGTQKFNTKEKDYKMKIKTRCLQLSCLSFWYTKDGKAEFCGTDDYDKGGSSASLAEITGAGDVEGRRATTAGDTFRHRRIGRGEYGFRRRGGWGQRRRGGYGRRRRKNFFRWGSSRYGRNLYAVRRRRTERRSLADVTWGHVVGELSPLWSNDKKTMGGQLSRKHIADKEFSDKSDEKVANISHSQLAQNAQLLKQVVQKNPGLPPRPKQWMPVFDYDEWMTAGSVRLLRSRNRAWGGTRSYEGEFYLALQGQGAAIYQTVAHHQKGKKYELRFAVAARPEFEQGKAVVQVWISGKKMLSKEITHKGFKQWKAPYVGTGPSMEVKLINACNPGDCTFFLDDIYIVEILPDGSAAFDDDAFILLREKHKIASGASRPLSNPKPIGIETLHSDKAEHPQVCEVCSNCNKAVLQSCCNNFTIALKIMDGCSPTDFLNMQLHEERGPITDFGKAFQKLTGQRADEGISASAVKDAGLRLASIHKPNRWSYGQVSAAFYQLQLALRNEVKTMHRTCEVVLPTCGPCPEPLKKFPTLLDTLKAFDSCTATDLRERRVTEDGPISDWWGVVKAQFAIATGGVEENWKGTWNQSYAGVKYRELRSALRAHIGVSDPICLGAIPEWPADLPSDTMGPCSLRPQIEGEWDKEYLTMGPADDREW